MTPTPESQQAALKLLKVQHPKWGPDPDRGALEYALRDAYAAGCSAAQSRSLVTAQEYAKREALGVATMLVATTKQEDVEYLAFNFSKENYPGDDDKVAYDSFIAGFEAARKYEPAICTPAPVDVRHAALADKTDRPKLGRSDWVDCPICGESDMRKQIDPDSDDGQGYIYCVNTNCGSNGGDNFAALRAHPAGGVSEDVVERVAEWLSYRYGSDLPLKEKAPEGQIRWRADARNALRAAGIGAGVVPEDVVRLVLAARAVAFDIVPDLVRSSPASPQIKNGALVLIKSLDRASEAFAERVPWDDEPEGT